MAKNAKNAKNAIVNTTSDLSKEDKKVLAEVKKQAIELALQNLQDAIGKDIAITTGQAGKLLASLDSQLSKLASDVAKTDEDAPVWALELYPVQIMIGEEEHKWVEVTGLDRNAKVQIVDNDGKCEILVSARSSKSIEEKVYFDALVESGKDLTKAIALRKAVAGKKFNQLFAIAKAQDKERLTRKYAKLVPPMSTVTKATNKKAIVA